MNCERLFCSSFFFFFFENWLNDETYYYNTKFDFRSRSIYSGPTGDYESIRDTIVLVNGQPMMIQPSSGSCTTGTTQKLPGPLILKNLS